MDFPADFYDFSDSYWNIGYWDDDFPSFSNDIPFSSVQSLDLEAVGTLESTLLYDNLSVTSNSNQFVEDKNNLLPVSDSATSTLHPPFETSVSPRLLTIHPPDNITPIRRNEIFCPDIYSQAQPNLSPPSGTSSPSPKQLSSSVKCHWATCNRICSSKADLNHHYKNHTRPYHCRHCPTAHATVTHLKRHINTRHSRSEEYFCIISSCPRSNTGDGAPLLPFLRKDTCDRHMRKIHKIGV